MQRIISATTGLFIRDDVMADKSEVALNAPPAQGFYWPKWDGEKWIEGKPIAEIAPILAAKAQAETEQTNKRTIKDLAIQALVVNKTYIDRLSPTAAQTTAEVKMLARHVNAIIRLLLNKFDATE